MPVAVDDFAVAVGAALTGALESGAATAPLTPLPPGGNYASQSAQQSCVLPADQEMIDGSYAAPADCVCYDDGFSSEQSMDTSSVQDTAPQPVAGDKPPAVTQPAAAPKSASPQGTPSDKTLKPTDETDGTKPPAEPPETIIEEFNRHMTAGTEAFAGAFLGLYLPSMFELALDIALIGQENTDYGRDLREDAEDAIASFKEFGEASVNVASNKSEVGAEVGSAVGGLGPEIVSPSSKAKAGIRGYQATKLVANGAKAKLLERLIERLLKSAERNKAKLRTAMEDLAKLAEKGEAYRILSKERKVLKTVPRKASKGEWFEKWTSFKDHQFEGKLKKPLNNVGTVQIDDLLVAEDGKLVLIETKALMIDDMGKSAHLAFAEDKVDTLLRYVQFAKENPDAVSHVKILGNNPEVLQIYKGILESQLVQKGASIGITPADVDRIVEYGLFWK